MKPRYAKLASEPGGRVVICCYCDARVLLPAQAGGQRLVCHSCGAPLQKIAAQEPVHHLKAKGGTRKKKNAPRPAEVEGAHLAKDRSLRRKKAKKSKPKGLLYRLGDAADDLLDFDDLFDFFD
ncbi:MAG: hypothetical protein AAFR17_17740 [Pseudomonadota bacterium]